MKKKGEFVKREKAWRWAGIVAVFFVLSACVSARDAQWRTVPEANMAYEKAWGIVVNAVTQHFDLETSDAGSGYLRTAWKTTKRSLGAEIQKSRVSVRVASRNPFRVMVRVEKQEYDGLLEKWIITGNDEKMEKDIIEELAGRLK